VSATAEGLQYHLHDPQGRGLMPDGACTGAAGGAACGDLVRISVALDESDPDGGIVRAGFDARGCGAMLAAGSAAVSLLRGTPLLDAARIGADEIDRELGGLSAAKRHAAELAADALHRALGLAARTLARLAPAPGRTLVAMSGGVDSAVAALLASKGCGEAAAVTLELWSDPENDGDLSCCSAQAVRSARKVAHGLGLPHLSIDLREEFRAGVVEPWLAGRAAGETPNPCVRCNGSVRLDAMLELATRLGASTLTTGHYARVQPDGLLRLAADQGKDQSYVLAALAPATLARLRFPLGELHKSHVREIAEWAGLSVAHRKDSQDLCFLAGTRQSAFLERHGGLQPRPGPIVDREGRVLGEHQGAHTFTVGQRRGIGIGGPGPLYVLETDARANSVLVGPSSALLSRLIDVRELVLHRDGRRVDGVRVRSHGRRLGARLQQDLAPGRHPLARIELAEASARAASGQLACLYAGDVLVGHGTITA